MKDDELRVSPWVAYAFALALVVAIVSLIVTAFTSDICPGPGCSWWWVLLVSLGVSVVAGLIVFRGADRRGRRSSAAQTAEGSPAKSQAALTSMIAHELKNPIMSIKGLAATGARLYDSMSDQERKEFFRLIDEESSRLKLVADQISTALKIDAGEMQYSMRPEPLTTVVEESVWKAPHGEHPMSVDAESDLVASIDRARIEEVLASVLDNAAKFSPPAEPVEVRARSQDGSAVVEVIDRGPGIAPEQRQAIFERFSTYRPEGYGEVPGAGLGLFISRAHVLAHGGSIEVEPGPQGGTMLRFTLPLKSEGD